MIRKQCVACAKPLGVDGGTVLMDRDGRIYHIQCWCQMMDAQAAAREKTKTAAWAATRKKARTDRRDPGQLGSGLPGRRRAQ
jgi:hypothetical protein